MCDINKKTRRKSVVVYKVCRKIDGKLYAYFSGMEVKTGSVKDMEFFHAKKGQYYPFHMRYVITRPNGEVAYNKNYNKNLIGRTSGFQLLETAKIFYSVCTFSYINPEGNVILKLTIGGDIMQGTGEGIMKHRKVTESITFAGTEILNVEEVRVRKRKIRIIPL